MPTHYRFDIPRFYTEAARILKPGGTLAAWTYDICTINGADSAATRALHAIYSGRGEGQLGPYWSDRRALVDRRYAGGATCLPGQALAWPSSVLHSLHQTLVMQ